MEVLIFLAGVVTLLLIFWQDLRYRAVAWPLFPLAGILLFLTGAFEVGAALQLNYLLFNLAFVLLNSALLFLWFRFKKVKAGEVLARFMGLGDFLFFGVMAMALPFPLFPVLFVFSLILVLFVAALFFRGKTVPLAGCQALILVLVLLFVQWRPVTFSQLMAF